MKKMFVVFVLCGLAACGGGGERDQETSISLEDEVSSFLEAYQTAIDSRDIDVLRTLYVGDGRFEWVEDGSVRYRSPDDVLAAFSGLPPDAPVQTEYEGRTITSVGDAGATVSMRFHTVVGEGPSAFEFGGMMTMVLEKGQSGWHIISGHTSSPRQGGR